MEIYKNLSGQSGVVCYEFGHGHITVEFKTRNKEGYNTYKYTDISTGQHNVEQMKKLAVLGRGLNTYIIVRVKKLYESKW